MIRAWQLLKDLKPSDSHVVTSWMFADVVNIIEDCGTKPLDLRDRELLLLVAERVLPFLSGHAAAEARTVLELLGKLLNGTSAYSLSQSVGLIINSLCVGASIRISSEASPSGTLVSVHAADIYALAHAECASSRAPISIQVLIEDMELREITVALTFECCSGFSKTFEVPVSDNLQNKLVTVLANGHEIFSRRVSKISAYDVVVT